MNLYTIPIAYVTTNPSQPTAVTGKIGDAVEFRVGASGTNLKYQWQYVLKGQNNWVNFTNGNACTMKKVLNETYDDLKVRVVITDGNGNSVTSNTVNVTIIKSEDWELPIM